MLLRIAAQPLGKSIHVAFQLIEISVFYGFSLIPVQPLVDLDLEAVSPLGGIAVAAHDLNPLIRRIDCHCISKIFQEVPDIVGKSGVAGCSVSVAEDKIGLSVTCPSKGMGEGGNRPERWHRMPVDMPDRSMYGGSLFNQG